MKIIAASILGLSMLFATASADAGVVGRPGVVVRGGVRGGFGPRVGWAGPRVGWGGPRVVVGAPYYAPYVAPAPYIAPAPIYVGGPRWWGPRYRYGFRGGFHGGWRR